MLRKISALLIIFVSTAASYGQSFPMDLPTSTLIPHYRLAVAYNTTTVLVFPAAVRPVDRGDRDIMATKQPGVENVLKVKAGRRNFAPTNLHVFTSDGHLYAFDVTYTDSMASSRDLTALPITGGSATISSPVLLSGQLMNDDDLHKTVALMRTEHSGSSIVKVRHERMTLAIEDIAQKGPLLFLRLHLQNRSNLRYQLDFLHCYMQDHRKAKRTSIQEKEIPLLYQDSIPVISGHTGQTIVIAMPIFTVAGGKEGVIEAYEHNGGRSLILKLHNRTLLRARPL